MSIKIKESHCGRFTKWAKARGMTVAQAASKVTTHDKEYSEHVKKMAQFAQNMKKMHKHAFGGQAQNNVTSQILRKPKVLANGGQVPIEVEGGEVAEEPNGAMTQYQGASHEQGGVDDTVPQGTNIFSDRLAIDGQTMAQRKLTREKSLNKLNKAAIRRPVDGLVKNAQKRQIDINDKEEQGDMLIQELANHMFNQPKQKAAYGGQIYANGTDDDGVQGFNPISVNNIAFPQFGDATNLPMSDNIDKLPTSGNGNIGNDNPTSDSWRALPTISDNDIPGTPSLNGNKSNINTPMTAGNYAGMIGTGINAIAPLINSKNAWKNRVQPTNPYLGFNHDALETNNNELATLAGQKDLALSNNLRNRTNSINRNNNSTRSLNTQRALNSGTDIVANDDENKISQGFAAQIMNILNNHAGLQTQRDNTVMQGNNQVQNQNRVDVENYYTNKGKDLGNLGTSLQKGGLDMNEQQHNQDFMSILPLLSKYGIGISYVNGKPTLVNS